MHQLGDFIEGSFLYGNHQCLTIGFFPPSQYLQTLKLQNKSVKPGFGEEMFAKRISYETDMFLSYM